jgi:hypothetical protein
MQLFKKNDNHAVRLRPFICEECPLIIQALCYIYSHRDRKSSSVLPQENVGSRLSTITKRRLDHYGIHTETALGSINYSLFDVGTGPLCAATYLGKAYHAFKRPAGQTHRLVRSCFTCFTVDSSHFESSGDADPKMIIRRWQTNPFSMDLSFVIYQRAGLSKQINFPTLVWQEVFFDICI